jgi:hypothetical protein
MFRSQSRCKITAFFSLLLPDKRTIPANTPLLVLPQGKVYFWGSNWAEFDKKHQKNAPIPKK